MQVDDAAWISLLMSLFSAAMALSIVIATFYFIRYAVLRCINFRVMVSNHLSDGPC